jgi:NitT/TauT family transport system substrate-binding protein
MAKAKKEEIDMEQKKSIYQQWLFYVWAIVLIAGILSVTSVNILAAEKLRVGQVYVWLGDIPQYVAEAKGYYKEKGLDVELTTFRGGGEVASALVGGSVDVCIGALDHAIKMKEKGLDVAVVLTIQEKLGFTMFVRKGLGIKKLVDLKGKTLETSAPGSSSDNYMRYLLATAGLDPLKDVTIVAGGGNEGRIAALKQGAADAGAVTEPATSIIMSEGFAEVLHDGTQWEYPFNVVIIKRDFLNKNRNAIKGFVEATLQGAKFAKANPQYAEETGLKLFPKSDPKVIRMAVRNYLPTFSENGIMTEKGYKFVMDLLLETKTVKAKVAMPTLVDNSLLPQK